MTGANACGNVGNVLSKHLQPSTSNTLRQAHFCHWFALITFEVCFIYVFSGIRNNIKRHIVLEAKSIIVIKEQRKNE